MSAVQKQDLPEELSIRANMLWNSAGSLTYLACQWLTTIVIVRLSTGYDDAGMLSLAMSVVGIFSTFANYKMGTYQVSDIRHEHSLSDYLGFRCFMLAVAFVACMAYAFLTCSPGALLTVALYYVYRGFGLAIDVLHGADQLERVLAATQALWGGGDIRDLDEATLAAATADLPRASLTLGESTVADALVALGFEKGKTAARRTISSGGASVNNVKVEDPEAVFSAHDLLAGGLALIRKGRKNLAVVELS